MPHLHLPAQSGSDTMLRRMARRNRVADFEALVAAARAPHSRPDDHHRPDRRLSGRE